MKKRWILVILGIFIMIGCFNEGKKNDLIIEADQYIINDDGLDIAKITPKALNYSNEEIKSKIHYFVNGCIYNLDNFSSTKIGIYTISAQIGRIKSNEILIKVVPKYRIIIDSKKEFIFNDGVDSAVFSAKVLNKNNEFLSTEKLEYFTINENGVHKLKNNIIISNLITTYNIYAKFEGYKSNRIRIDVESYFRIEFTADKDEIIADGNDEINFSCKIFDQNNNYYYSHNIYVNDIRIKESVYKSNKVGKCTAYAIVRGLKSEKIVFNVKEIPVEANPGISRSSYVGFKVQLDGSKSKNGGREKIDYSWNIISKPDGSKLELDNKKIEKPTFKADKIGKYIISLAVNNGVKTSKTKEIVIKVKKFNDFSSDLDLTEIKESGFLDLNFDEEGFGGNCSFEIETLTDGWIIIGEKNKITIANAITGEIGKEIQLKSSPTKMQFDYENGILWCNQENIKEVAKVSIKDEKIDYITTFDEIGDIVLGNDGYVFGVSEKTDEGSINIIDTKTDKVIKKCKIIEEAISEIKYKKSNDNLFLTVNSNDIDKFNKYSFNKDTLEFKLIEASSIKVIKLLISPNEEHVAVLGETANGRKSGNYDLDSNDLSYFYGEWETENFNFAADFSNDDKMIAISESEKVLIFSVETHAKLKKIRREGIYNWKIFFSKENKLVYGVNIEGIEFYNIGEY